MISTVLKRFKGAAILGAAFTVIGSSVAQPAPDQKTETAKRELIVKFREAASDNDIERGIKRGRARVKRHLQSRQMRERGHNGLTVIESDLGSDAAVQALKNDPAIEYVEPNIVYHHHAVSNDPYVTGNYTWGLYGDQSSPANNFGSQAAEAWAAGYTGTNTVFVAVIDEGVDISHPDLVQNIWTNPYDPVDGIDNDGNGYVDDTHGWDFHANKNQVFDPTGDTHGTHVAGTIGARGGNSAGVAGVNWNVSIIPGKFLGADGGNTLDAVEAIDYFIDLKKRHGINLVAINASWGGGGYSQSLHDAIIRAAKAGILFIAAAGNDAQNNDLYANYPANLDARQRTSTETAASYDNVVSVAAFDSAGALASFSNYGATKVDLGAPGVQILSLAPAGQYGYMSGTSMATPHVTGAAALYASTHPGASAQSIRQALTGSLIATPSLAGKTVTGGRLNLSAVIAPTAAAPVTLPATPTGVNASISVANVAGNATVTVRWTAVAGAASYKVYRSSSVTGPWTAVTTGVTGTSYSQTLTANGVPSFYYVVAVNTGGDSAASSNVAVTPLNPAPGSLTTVSASTTAIQLKWADRSADEQGFRLEYWNGSSWVQFGTAAANTSSVNVTGAARGTTYQFRIRAYNGTTNTAYSNVASGRTL